ncbi:MAG: hypothetical protein HKO57_00455, partial [Akkermansiaceae bacterium]|nr:hypothetical protein [Akkermansiaceae bacterium]
MNAKYILGIAAAGICGALLAAGILKSMSSEPEKENAAAAAPAEPSASTSRTAEKAGSPETPAPAADAGDDAAGDDAGGQGDEELAARREEFRSNMRKQQMDRLTTKMAKWGAALNLDQNQQERLLEIADGQLDELEKMAVDARDSGDPAAVSAAAQRAMSIIGGEALEESMTALLTPDQKRAYEEFGARQDESRAEARALRQLAGLQEDLMLSPEQRNSVYAILYEDATTEVQ